MSGNDLGFGASRRAVLRSAAVGTTSLALVGTAGACEDEDHEDDGGEEQGFDCGYDDPWSGPGHVYPPHHDACADDHPGTIQLQEECAYALDHHFPDVGTLIAKGYVPYFDNLAPFVYGFSHWFNFDYMDNGVMLDPGRPASILVDDYSRCPFGIMFFGDHDVTDEEPPVYVECDDPDSYNHEQGHAHDHDGHGDHGGGDDDGGHDDGGHDGHGGGHDGHGGHDDDCVTCAPWHGHTDMPARFGWWVYRHYETADQEDQEAEFRCVTPKMLHVWPYEDGADIYAHDAPPREERGTATTCAPVVGGVGGDTDGPLSALRPPEPLSPAQLPAEVRRRAMPEPLEAELAVVEALGEELYTMSVAEAVETVGGRAGTLTDDGRLASLPTHD